MLADWAEHDLVQPVGVHMKQLNGIVFDKYKDEDDYNHFVLKSNGTIKDIKGVPRSVYNKYDYNDKVCVIIDDKNRFIYTSNDIKWYNQSANNCTNQ